MLELRFPSSDTHNPYLSHASQLLLPPCASRRGRAQCQPLLPLFRVFFRWPNPIRKSGLLNEARRAQLYLFPPVSEGSIPVRESGSVGQARPRRHRGPPGPRRPRAPGTVVRRASARARRGACRATRRRQANPHHAHLLHARARRTSRRVRNQQTYQRRVLRDAAPYLQRRRPRARGSGAPARGEKDIGRVRQVSRVRRRPALARHVARRSAALAKRWLSHEDFIRHTVWYKVIRSDLVVTRSDLMRCDRTWRVHSA